MRYDRPCIRYLDALYRYVTIDSLEDPAQIWEYARPYFEVHYEYEEGIWAFLDDLDTQLETQSGQTALTAVEEYIRK